MQMATLFKQLFELKYTFLLLILASQLSLIQAKNSKIRTSKSKIKTGSGSKNSVKLDTTKVYDDSENLLYIDNETDDIPLNLPDEQVLITDLLKNYDPAARPVYNASMPVVVRFNFALFQIIDMDERNQILTTNVIFCLIFNFSNLNVFTHFGNKTN